MLKVSFKEDCKKIQTFNDKAIIITMVGYMTIPNELWSIFPNEVANWMWDHSGVDASWGPCTKHSEVIRLEFSGKSVCAKGDTFDAVVGERIAESRAKIKLYKFMYTLANKLCTYYSKLLLGYTNFSPAYNRKGTLYAVFDKYRDLYIKESHHLCKLIMEP